MLPLSLLLVRMRSRHPLKRGWKSLCMRGRCSSLFRRKRRWRRCLSRKVGLRGSGRCREMLCRQTAYLRILCRSKGYRGTICRGEGRQGRIFRGKGCLAMTYRRRGSRGTICRTPPLRGIPFQETLSHEIRCKIKNSWGWVDLNHRRPKSRDLQSRAIGHYATPPKGKDAGSRN